jgi:hypothetical protein
MLNPPATQDWKSDCMYQDAIETVTDYIPASEKEIALLKMELSLRRPTDAGRAQTIKARKDYRAKLKELYGNADALPMEVARLKSQIATQAELLKRAREVAQEIVRRADEGVNANGGPLSIQCLEDVSDKAAQLVKEIGEG